jgi:hypothetical protein
MNPFVTRFGRLVSLGLLAAGCGSYADPAPESERGSGNDPNAVVVGDSDGVFTSAADLGAEGAPPSDAAEVADQAPVTLNSFRAGEETFEFQELTHSDGTRSFLIAETAPATQSELLTTRLRKEFGALTALETFYALAPEGSIPHERLAAHHAEETAVLGRADDSVRRVDFDAAQPIEKTTQSCWDTLFATSKPWIYGGMKFNKSGNNTVCTGVNFSCNYYVTNTQIDVSWCNESSASMTTAWAIGVQNVNNGAYGSEYTQNVAAGTVRQLGIVPQSDYRRYYIRGNSSGLRYHLGFLIHEEE